MPRLTFAIAPDGLRLPALVGPDGASMQALHAAGMPLPRPLQVRALIDTGSDVTALCPWVTTSLALPPSGAVQTQTVGGATKVHFYSVSLALFDPAAPPATNLFRPTWTVTDLPQDLADTDLLIGMDLISELVLLIDGPGKQFTLTF